MYIYIYVCICICMYVCMYVCMYLYTVMIGYVYHIYHLVGKLLVSPCFPIYYGIWTPLAP